MSTRLLAACLIAVTSHAAVCAADVIDFSALAAPNGSPYAGSIEGQFTVAVAAGGWFEAHQNGNPVPNIFGTSEFGSIDITENTTGLFTFEKIDIDDASLAGLTFTLIGYRNNREVLSLVDYYPGGEFATIFSPEPGRVLDRLNIGIYTTTSSYNLDNIVVHPVPEPASGAVGLSVLTALGRRSPSRTRCGPVPTPR